MNTKAMKVSGKTRFYSDDDCFRIYNCNIFDVLCVTVILLAIYFVIRFQFCIRQFHTNVSYLLIPLHSWYATNIVTKNITMIPIPKDNTIAKLFVRFGAGLLLECRFIMAAICVAFVLGFACFSYVESERKL